MVYYPIMFHVRNRSLYVERVPVGKLAGLCGTPLYIYSQAQLLRNFNEFERAFKDVPHVICYALKANSNLSVARTFSQAGAGADIVSAGELYRAALAGFPPEKIVFSGVGKTADEMRYALDSGILMFNVESMEELAALNRVARSLGRKAPVAIRVNPDVEAGSHRHISTGTAENKFGIQKRSILEAYRTARSLGHIEVLGIQAHIGSQITSARPFLALLLVLLRLVDELSREGIRLRVVDVGGGIGITYHRESPPSPSEIARSFIPLLRGRNLKLLFEPGRFLVGNAGILATRVLYRKHSGRKRFVIVDAAMNDLARPALYDAYHRITPARSRPGRREAVDVVGPVCESGDYFARGRKMVLPGPGEVLAIENAGAYGFAMSSQYNSRPRAAEILVNGRRWDVVRERETLKDLVHGEK